MAEAAGVVVGVLSLAVEAVKVYRELGEIFQAIRHYSRELCRMQKRVRFEQEVFENECCIILNSVLSNGSSPHLVLRAPQLSISLAIRVESQLRSRLGSSYRTCRDLIEDIRDTLGNIQRELDFGIAAFTGKPRPTLEHARLSIRKTRSAVAFAFKKERYLRRIDELRDLREDLTAIRSQMKDLELRQGSRVPDKQAKAVVPEHLRAIRTASASLYAAFFKAWNTSCPDIAHLQHKTLLCVDAKVEGTVLFDFAISFTKSKAGHSERLITQVAPTWLHVRSTPTDLDGEQYTAKETLSFNPSPDSLADGQGSSKKEPDSQLGSTHGDKSFRDFRSDDNDLMPKNQLEHSDTRDMNGHPFSPDDHGSYRIRSKGMSEPSLVDNVALDLCRCDNICDHILQYARGKEDIPKSFGYLNSSKALTHHFYPAAKCTDSHGGKVQRSTFTLADLLQDTTELSLTPIEWMTVAHKIAMAVLQFHSTAWLESQWGLKHLSFFRDIHNEKAVGSIRRTLHLTAEYPRSNGTAQPAAQSQADAPAEGVQHDPEPRSPSVDVNSYKTQSSPPIHKALLYGIDNETLCSLGIALLEIAYRQPIESLRREGEPSNIYAARRLALYSTTPLGPKYQNIVRKCMRCDFNSGTNLESTELQSAIWSDVVCELERLAGIAKEIWA